VTLRLPGNAIAPPELKVAVAEGVCRLKLLAPAVTMAVLVNPAAVTPGVQPKSTLFALLSQQ